MREDVRGRGESGIGRGGFQIARVFPGCCLEVTEGARGSGGGADANGDARCEDLEIAMFVSWMNWLVL
jgi:hypothetical protein